MPNSWEGLFLLAIARPEGELSKGGGEGGADNGGLLQGNKDDRVKTNKVRTMFMNACMHSSKPPLFQRNGLNGSGNPTFEKY